VRRLGRVGATRALSTDTRRTGCCVFLCVGRDGRRGVSVVDGLPNYSGDGGVGWRVGRGAMRGGQVG
jgi:hypothetical protein